MKKKVLSVILAGAVIAGAVGTMTACGGGKASANVEFYDENGTLIATVYKGQTIQVPTYTSEGGDFKGWLLDTASLSGETIRFTADVAVTSIQIRYVFRNITYRASGIATGRNVSFDDTEAATSYTLDSNTVLNAKASLSGYTFAGWTMGLTEKDGVIADENNCDFSCTTGVDDKVTSYYFFSDFIQEDDVLTVRPVSGTTLTLYPVFEAVA